MMSGYPGAKAGAGVRQQILSLMPPHRTYVEAFLGSGQIFYAKKPADVSIVIDRDEVLVRRHAAKPRPSTTYVVGDALQLLASLKLTRQDLVYADPPYHPDTRSHRRLYRYELERQGHSTLLAVLQGLDCNVILSGYRHASYDAALRDWYRLDYGVMTRGGRRVESAWCNFTPYQQLHDTRYVGANFRERERIKRKKGRWVSRFKAMPPAERNVIAEALREAEASIAACADSRSIIDERGDADRAGSSRQ